MKLWKIERDSYYSGLFHQHGLDYVFDAGFFYDTDETDRNVIDTTNILCTPVAFLEKNRQKPCILVTTGSFCPPHYGHIQMMEAAKAAVEKKGFQVIGGYLSPSHDEYVKAKTRAGWIPIYQRLSLLKKTLVNHPWLEIDPWEGLFNKVAINFTDVLDRTQAYIDKHFGPGVAIMYVCGEDNYRFHRTFTNKGYCVIVNRPNYSGVAPFEHPRIFFAEGSADISSTTLRSQVTKPLEKKSLQLRVNDCDLNEVQILGQLVGRFSQTTFHQLTEQRIAFENLTKNNNVISLDTELSKEYTLGLSRHYDLFGGTMLRYGNRPGTPALEQQIKRIPTGRYMLFDDDIHTGKTMRYAKHQLEYAGNKITSIVSLNISNPDANEILDARDFLFGLHPNGGLVVQFPNGKITRVPYLYPYVCPFLRASILDPKRFSIELWKLNAEMHKETQLKVSDVAYLQDFAEYLDYPATMLLRDICLKHVEMLEK